MRVFLDSIDLSVWILVGVLVALVIAGILIFILCIRGSQKKKVVSSEKKYLAIKAVLTEQDSSLLSRLEKISHSNLQYSDIYEEYLRQFKLMLDGDCKYIERDIEILKECLVKKNVDSFKKVFEDCKKATAIFKDKVNAFDNSLHETIQPEENSMVNLVRIKEAYRSLKSKYSVNEKNLEIVAESIGKVFEKIDATFVQFEELVERAEYDEANALLPTLHKVIESLENKIEELPALCVRIDQVIPANIKELGLAIRDKEERGLPTYVLGYNKKVIRWADELKILKQSLKDFKFGGAKDTLNKIQEEIDATYEGLKRELEDKAYFEKHYPTCSSNIDLFDKKYLRLSEKIPDINNVYVLGVQRLNDLEILKECASDLASLKRGLDNFVQSGLKQPYSVLKNKLDELIRKYEESNSKLEDFKAYIESIKSDSQNAYNMLYEYYNHLREIESKIRAMNSVKYYNESIDNLEACYKLLNDLNSSLHAKPLNISSLNEDLKDLKSTADPLFTAVEEDYRLMCLAESAIVFNNRDRDHQSDVHEKLKLIENQFLNCEFEKAYQEASELYKSKHIGE